MGHLIGMYLFGYRNVQMFFIPFFGAAVSGQSQNVASYKKAIVSLLGPGPGLLLGVICLIVYAKTGNNFLLSLANLFLLLNLFNLLPFSPLDGGRFLCEILFSRNRYVELIFNLFASLALITVGFFMKSWVLSIIGFFNLVTMNVPFKIAGIANELKKNDLIELSPENDESQISRNYPYKYIINSIKTRMSGKLDTKTIARFTQNVIDCVSCRPPKALPTIGLLTLYIFFWLAPAIMLFAVFQSGIFTKTKIVKCENTQGNTTYAEQAYVFGKLSYQVELSEDQKLYHGKEIHYNSDGSVAKESNWSNGRWDGEAKIYDQQGNLIRVAVFDNGKFVSQKELIDSKWVEQTWDDLSFDQQQLFNSLNEEPPYGPE